jgi:hypothetical protein
MRYFILGFSSNDLSPDEQAILDQHVSKYATASWSNNKYSLIDTRHNDFSDAKKAIQEDEDRNVSIYGDFELPSKDHQNDMLNAVKELDNELSNVKFEVHTESEKLL